MNARASLSDYLTAALDAVIRFFWPESAPTFPAWLYTVTDLQWLVLFQVFVLVVVYMRTRRIRREYRAVIDGYQELWREVKAQSVDTQMRIEKLRADFRKGSNNG